MKMILMAATGVVLAGISLSARAEDVAERPLPTVETVLKRVVENSEQENERDHAFNQRYSYTRTRAMEFRNSKGELKKREERKSRNTPAAVPVAYCTQPAEAGAEGEKEARKSGPVTETNSNVRGKAFEKKDFSLNDDLLARFEFTMGGREAINGRQMLILDFKPAKRKPPERNIKDRLINKAAGRVWVDETDGVLAKVDVHLTDNVNVVGGLVGAVWKFSYGFNRERLPDGFWFTRSVDWHLEGREVIFRRTVDCHEEKADVRKSW
jgi:hypothetical protein